MSGEYVPSMDEDAFMASSFIDFHTQEPPSGEWIPMTEDEARERWEKWLAERDTRIASEAAERALREAADAYNGSDDLADYMRSWQWDEHVAFLRARADRLANEREGES